MRPRHGLRLGLSLAALLIGAAVVSGFTLSNPPPDSTYYSSGVLAVTHGGTGTATPSLTAGAGISLSGTWPANTITNSDDAYFTAGVLAIANGGTGTATPALTAGAGISLSGTWPANTITNSDDSYFAAGILAVAHGGTGTATPALTAGTNITITGTWPANTITAAAAGSGYTSATVAGSQAISSTGATALATLSLGAPASTARARARFSIPWHCSTVHNTTFWVVFGADAATCFQTTPGADVSTGTGTNTTSLSCESAGTHTGAITVTINAESGGTTCTTDAADSITTLAGAASAWWVTD